MLRPSLLLPALLLTLAACASDPEPPDAPPGGTADADTLAAGSGATVLGIVRTAPDLSTFARAVEAAGLGPTLADPGQVLTVFAPTNAAFRALPDGELDRLLADPDRLAALLRGHVLSTRLFSTDLAGSMTMETLGGTDLTLDADGEALTVSDGHGGTARVVTPDLDTENGVVHTIDHVLGTP